MTELSAYVLEPIREGPDFTLYRGRQQGNPSRVLAVALAAEHQSPQGLRRLEHEYSLAAERDSAWAAKPPGANSSLRADDPHTHGPSRGAP